MVRGILWDCSWNSRGIFFGELFEGIFFWWCHWMFFSDCWWDLMEFPTVGFYDGFDSMFLVWILRDFSMGIDDDTMQSSGI